VWEIKALPLAIWPSSSFAKNQKQKGKKKMDMDVKIVAYGFPALCVALGALLLLTNQTLKSSELSNWGGTLIVIGAGMQAFYMLLRYGRRSLE
jgi:hypothetical protein